MNFPQMMLGSSQLAANVDVRSFQPQFASTQLASISVSAQANIPSPPLQQGQIPAVFFATNFQPDFQFSLPLFFSANIPLKRSPEGGDLFPEL